METEASFSPKDALGEEYADISSEQAQQMMDSIIPEVIDLLYATEVSKITEISESTIHCHN